MRLRRQRLYPRGAIKAAVLKALDSGLAYPAEQITSACHIVYGIDAEVAGRNLRALCSQGIVRNVGTRKRAMYQLRSEEK